MVMAAGLLSAASEHEQSEGAGRSTAEQPPCWMRSSPMPTLDQTPADLEGDREGTGVSPRLGRGDFAGGNDEPARASGAAVWSLV
jgi:hypothetical protein